MGRTICVVSGKGGVGKTTIATMLAGTLAKNRKSVCLIDLDVGMNNVDVLLGLENKVVYDLGDCLNGRCRLKQALVSDANIENLYLLPSIRYSKDKITMRGVRDIVNRLSQVFDYVVIDAPAGIGENFEIAVNSVSEAIVVVTPHISSLRDADKVISRLKGLSMQNVSVVVNRIRGDMVARKEMLNHNQIQTLLKTPTLGVIPESDDINILSSFKFERLSRSKIVSAFNILVNNLRFDKKEIYDYEGPYRGIVGIIRRNIKRSV